MSALSRNYLPGAIGACTVVAGLALLAAVAASGDAIGRSVVTLLGGGFALGVLAGVVRELVARSRGGYYAMSRTAPEASVATTSAAVVALPAFADATASEFDEVEQPAFAPVVSLTEAQVERQRAGQRVKERRATLNRA